MQETVERQASMATGGAGPSPGPVVVWGALLLLLGLTLGASYVLSGLVGLCFALAVASTKSALIFWKYMHLQETSPLLRIAALGAGFWILILLLFVLADYLTRHGT